MDRTTTLFSHPDRFNQVQTMTSREIAELTGKEHFNVLVDIRKMLAELGEDVLKFQGIYLDSMNRQQTEFLLDRELTDTLLTGYSAVARRKVIARWRELEAQAARPTFTLPDFTNPAVAARAWADAMELSQSLAIKSAQQQTKLALAAPKAAFVDAYVDATGLKGFRQVAKLLEVKENEFRKFLADQKSCTHWAASGCLARRIWLRAGSRSRPAPA